MADTERGFPGEVPATEPGERTYMEWMSSGDPATMVLGARPWSDLDDFAKRVWAGKEATAGAWASLVEQIATLW